ncbi:MAG: DUF342 domain-containing protein [Chitinispirillaceae bacterium]|nr:DUF342 domain-containing protein [Chitinispirillaceae bacterium]
MTDSSESFKLEMVLRVSIEDDGYQAYVHIRQIDPKTGFTTRDLADFLRRHSVTYGFELSRFQEVLDKIKTGPEKERISVAKGKKVAEGKDGHEEYRFRTQLLVGEQTDKKIDYRERGLINNVRPGQVIALIEREIPGKPGIKVTGEKIDPPPVCSVKVPRRGCNVDMYTEKRTTTFVAMVAGNARKLFDEIQVTKDFIINSDLDYTKGNIDFVGNVGIFGDVKSGFTVRADGDIMISGNVEPNARVESEKNISVKKAVRCGMGNGMFYAKGDISAGTVINSRIEAGGNVFIKDFISESDVYCEGVFASSWGTILGSTIEAIGGINVNNIGKENSLTKNALYSGKSVLSAERLKKIEDELANLRNEIALVAKKVSIERQEGPAEEMDARERDRVKQIGIARTAHIKQSKERIAELEEEQRYLLGRYRVNPEAVMVVKGKVYPTTLLCNGAQELSIIEREQNGVKLEYSEEPKSETR